MNHRKNLTLDAILWVVVMVLAASAAFYLLRRDAQRDFGAVAFGSFPDFNLPTITGEIINQHLMKGKVWAVHAGSSSQNLQSIAQELIGIQERTASGKRRLYVLSILEAEHLLAQPLSKFHYAVYASVHERGFLLTTLGPARDSIVLLVDQNSVIRGRYDIKDVDGLRAFQGDLKRIL